MRNVLLNQWNSRASANDLRCKISVGYYERARLINIITALQRNADQLLFPLYSFSRFKRFCFFLFQICFRMIYSTTAITYSEIDRWYENWKNFFGWIRNRFGSFENEAWLMLKRFSVIKYLFFCNILFTLDANLWRLFCQFLWDFGNTNNNNIYNIQNWKHSTQNCLGKINIRRNNTKQWFGFNSELKDKTDEKLRRFYMVDQICVKLFP